ncbi:hypothetical protein BT63DRAFT_223145 [Microthyrium microscopicum]|uniref:ubiquitinyl hydrolase 1 n=1 Tax=Microthyrium microscopicum TaxID=703497 RepID=A0A6A6UCG5_9PEZI|nr:hypothetical protein BT63DRAFT_223145 [Microthyrium microscopicum]
MEAMDEAPSDSRLLESVVDHVCLHTNLPHEQEKYRSYIEDNLNVRLTKAAIDIRDFDPHKGYRVWDAVRGVLRISQSIHADGYVIRESLLNEIRGLQPNSTIIVYIAEQNSGLFIRRIVRGEEDTVRFEATEASAKSEKVLDSSNALEWTFFSQGAAQIPYSTFCDPSFQLEVAAFLDQCSTESVKRFALFALKAGTETYEKRESVNPALITSLFITMIEALGERVYPPALRKRIRDDVCWKEGLDLPWRRSGRWLVLRVGVLRQLTERLGAEPGRACYKLLFCIFMMKLLNDCVSENLSIDLTNLVKAKFARRLSKLGTLLRGIQSTIWHDRFRQFAPKFRSAIKSADKYMTKKFGKEKSLFCRRVPSVPGQAAAGELLLPLPNSEHYLSEVLDHAKARRDGTTASMAPVTGDLELDTSEESFDRIASRYHSLAQVEHENQSACKNPTPAGNSATACLSFATRLQEYIELCQDAYVSNPRQCGVMILSIMELWVCMDKYACAAYPLLSAYNPLFRSEQLNFLILSEKEDIIRLNAIQGYLSTRTADLEYPKVSIFDGPSKGCFAEKFYEQEDYVEKFKALREKINLESAAAKKEKQAEWTKSNDYYAEEHDEFLSSVHDCFVKGRQDKDLRKECDRCYHLRCMRRTKIFIHENFLPEDSTSAKAVIFELLCPNALEAYRSVTWTIIATIALPPDKMDTQSPPVTLHEFEPMKNYFKRTVMGVGLASTTKVFTGTHYKKIDFPTPLESVCLPNALTLEYFDNSSKTWTSRRPSHPFFSHMCTFRLNTTSPIKSLEPVFDSLLSSIGPSSNEVLAREPLCPQGFNVHEFTSYQTLCSDINNRWLKILIEMVSPTMNFSKEDTTIALDQLICHVGSVGPTVGFLRDANHLLIHKSLCELLCAQIDLRLDAITANWRENHAMETLITLISRLLGFGVHAAIAQTLLLKARAVTLSWIRQLREEAQQTKDDFEASRVYFGYALWASLLCRRTYWPDLNSGQILSPILLSQFISCAITIQNSFDVGEELAKPCLLKSALVRDIKATWLTQQVVKDSITQHPEGFMAAVNEHWPESKGTTRRTYSNPIFLEDERDGWVEMHTTGSVDTKAQVVHFHILRGNLRIDYLSLGRLPVTIRENPILQQLFGQQGLLTLPSDLHNMTYVLANNPEGHEIHIGFRNKTVIVHVRYEGSEYELIPQTVFGDHDLPFSLVKDCSHWLNLETEMLEIRPAPAFWVKHSRNWLLGWKSRTATSLTSKRGAHTLINPLSPVAQQISAIFADFEQASELTIYRNDQQVIFVDLKRFQLTFRVTPHGKLICDQLHAEICKDQDALTWYGLDSKLVLWDLKKQTQRVRKIITPIGDLSCQRRSGHVKLTVHNNGDYGLFTINELLGRIECASEPRLLYFKAMVHAYTSSAVPDPLTKRTGTEEAVSLLTSGAYQPWAPIEPAAWLFIQAIARLSPKRGYYPKGIKFLSTTSRDPNFGLSMQHEAYALIAASICQASNALAAFTLKSKSLVRLPEPGNQHLLERAYSRRQLYERPLNVPSSDIKITDRVYDSRDRGLRDNAAINALYTASLVRSWPNLSKTTTDLAEILEQWPLIQGFQTEFSGSSLSASLDLSFATEFGSLIQRCMKSTKKQLYNLLFLLSTISFRHKLNLHLIRVLLAFAVNGKLKALKIPSGASYTDFRRGEIPTIESLLGLITPLKNKWALPTSVVTRSPFFDLVVVERKRKEEFDSHAITLAEHLISQWPCPEPEFQNLLELFPNGYVSEDISKIKSAILTEWLRLFHNYELSEYIKAVQKELRANRTPEDLQLVKLRSPTTTLIPKSYFISTRSISKDLLGKQCTWVFKTSSMISLATQFGGTFHKLPSPLTKQPNSPRSPESEELASIAIKMRESPSVVRNHYFSDLLSSLDALEKIGHTATISQDLNADVSSWLEKAIKDTEKKKQGLFSRITQALLAGDGQEQWLITGGLYPPLTTCSLLELLRTNLKASFGRGMKEALVKFALTITTLQQLFRIKEAQTSSVPGRMRTELRTVAHANWNPEKYTDWLLLEIESNILIRPDQVDVALATIDPATGQNSVLQMNMGLGKTSVIIPMVASVLANTQQLVRIVVPRSLLPQTVGLIQTRLGHLIGRPVIQIPFSRQTSTSSKTIQKYHQLHLDMMQKSGIIISLPENLLSFKLSGLQRLSDLELQESKEMIEVQSWLQNNCRDVLDECDALLAVRTQLIYPSGTQSMVDGHPHRWEVAEALLSLVQGHLWDLQTEFPNSIEVISRTSEGNSFPLVSFLRADVEEALMSRIVKSVISGGTSTLPIADCTEKELAAIDQFLTNPMVNPSALRLIEEMSVFQEYLPAKKNLYLLRGLLAHKILLMSLKKRWNVQYGLHPQRDPIAVPFLAKGVPSDHSEWGHCDVAILLTCLSFYLGGLGINHLQQALHHLGKCDDPPAQYNQWIQNAATLPECLSDITLINADDDLQLNDLLKHLAHNVVVINYFLNNLVFPRHAKQFEVKLQASGWDIPLISAGQDAGNQSNRLLTTGFSGTNDSRNLLPLTIRQEDLKTLAHTNAEVLTYLLQKRNREYHVAADSDGRRISEKQFLDWLQGKGLRILLDSGAHILEMSNVDLAKAWLQVDKDAKAALFFNENKPMILYRNHKQTTLSASPFADNLDGCLVYIDEAHTRGTDLKLPAQARAAITLGFGQTKDHTVQAAMRMRQLATTQAVVWFATPDVHQSILDQQRKEPTSSLDSHDVVCWLLQQTCHSLEQLQPLWHSQGVDFCHRAQTSFDHPAFLTEVADRTAYLDALRQQEHQTIDSLYDPRPKANKSAQLKPSTSKIGTFAAKLIDLQNDFQDFGQTIHESVLQEVEQEREVTYEVEIERQMQIPIRYAPLKYPGLHRDIAMFVNTGVLNEGSEAIIPFLKVISSTALGQTMGINLGFAKSKLFVSWQYLRTVELEQPNDNFLRPVNWILINVKTNIALVVVPEEANRLVRGVTSKSTCPHVHLLVHAAPFSKKMLPFNDLSFCGIPALPAQWSAPTWLKVELGIFSGRLYFAFDEYSSICQYLGIPPQTTETKTVTFQKAIETFTAKPLTFIKEWLATRRKCQDFTHTPMGYICDGKVLTENHPFFAEIEHCRPKAFISHRPAQVVEEFDDLYDMEFEEYEEYMYDDNEACPGEEDISNEGEETDSEEVDSDETESESSDSEE